MGVLAMLCLAAVLILEVAGIAERAFLSAARIRCNARCYMPKAMVVTTHLAAACAASHISASPRTCPLSRRGVGQRKILLICQPPSPSPQSGQHGSAVTDRAAVALPPSAHGACHLVSGHR